MNSPLQPFSNLDLGKWTLLHNGSSSHKEPENAAKARQASTLLKMGRNF